ncbi:MAG: hypothetical protein ACK5LJ_08340 [Paracoccus sp. (in: a-proteobacteria)]
MRVETYRDGKLVKTETVPDPVVVEDDRAAVLADAIASATTVAQLKAALLGTETGVPVAPDQSGDPS